MTGQPRRVGRPSQGGPTPSRSIRLGPIYDRALKIAKHRGDKLPAILEQALHAYVREHEVQGTDYILTNHLARRLFLDPELDLDDLDHIQDGAGFVIDSAGSGGGKVRTAGVRAGDWPRVKAEARRIAQWLADTDDGVLEAGRPGPGE